MSTNQVELTNDELENSSLSAMFINEEDQASGSSSSHSSNSFERSVNSLSIPLRLLFSLNGVTLSMATVPIMYIVNTRIAIPLAYVPSYWALEFLPYSLKPLYAAVNIRITRRDYLLSFLLCTCGLSYMSAIFIKKGPYDILCAFAMGFLQGICTSFPEFLLGLSLLDQARSEQSRLKTTNTIMEGKTAAALYQSQAATARNFGSLTASLAVFFILSSTKNDSKQLNDTVVNRLFLMIALLNITASIFVWKFSIGLPSRYKAHLSENREHDNEPSIIQYQRNSSYESLGQVEELQQEQFADEDDTMSSCDIFSTAHCQHFDDNRFEAVSACAADGGGDDSGDNGKLNSWINTSLIIVLQLVIITFAVRGPILDHIQSWIWNIVAGSLIVSLVIIFLCWLVMIWQPRNSKQNSWWVGLFLISRHIIPKPGSLVYSFFYTLLQNKASIFQLLSVLDNAVVTISSWMFGNFFSTWSVKVVAGTTFLALSVSLAYGRMIKFILIHHEDDEDESSWEDGNLWFLVAYIVLKVIGSFTGEWRFLPDVILATETAAATADVNNGNISLELARRRDETEITYNSEVHNQDFAEEEQNERYRTRTPQATAEKSMLNQEEAVSTSEMEYGVLISCIDFGGQLGTLLVGPLVTALDVTRENQWKNLNVIVELSAWLEMIPVLLLISSVVIMQHCRNVGQQ